jgi:hypothetical protein
MNCKEIIEKYLIENGYHGLQNSDLCSCVVDDLQPCENDFSQCTPAYLQKCENCIFSFECDDKNRDDDFFCLSDIPPNKKMKTEKELTIEKETRLMFDISDFVDEISFKYLLKQFNVESSEFKHLTIYLRENTEFEVE